MTSIAIPAPPILRSTELDDKDGPHPDTRPCPPWCWVVTDNPDSFAHEILQDRIHEAHHSIGGAIDVRASLYGADQEGGRVVRTATVEGALEQDGAAEPVIRVALRDYVREQDSDGLYRVAMKYDPERLRLSVEDARELAAVLIHLADVADSN